jgi:membrane-bound acyltransferase YfiQ involved in biofilm formation
MIRRLLYLNGVSISCVILFHAVGMGFTAMFAWAHRYLPAGVPAASQIGSPSYFALRAIEQLVIFCIPAFLFVSGYFIAVATGKNRTMLGWDVVWARLKMLWIPYLLWTAIILSMQVIIEDKSLSLRRLSLDIFTGETNEVMYFIPLLTQFYLLSPLFVWLAKKNWQLLLVGVFILQVAVQLLAYPMFLGWETPNAVLLPGLVPKWFFLSKVLWFPLGIIFGLNLEQLKPFLHRWRWVFLSLALLAIPIGILEWELYFRLSGQEWLSHRETIEDTVYSLAVLLSFLAFSQARLPLPRQMEKLGSKSYGIYLTHALFIQYMARLVYHLAPQLLGYQILFQSLLILVGFAGPLLLMYFFERSPVRSYYRYVFG